MTTTLERTDFETKVRRVEAILREAGAREVYVFGPAVEKGSRDLDDVRFAVRGLPPEVYYKTLADVWDVTGSFPTVQNLEDDDPLARFLEQHDELRPVDAFFR